MNFFTSIFRSGSKKTPEHALQDLIASLKAVLGEDLRAVIVFGSFASGEFLEGKSSLNVLILAETLAPQRLTFLAAPFNAWARQKHMPPILMRTAELPTMAGVLPIEFSDILDHHRVVFGDISFAQLRLDPARLRFQVEHDLAILLLRLRRSAARADFDAVALGTLVADSLSSTWTLCRALLRAHGVQDKMSKVEAARRLCAAAALDEKLVERLEACRISRNFVEGDALFSAYLELVEKLLHYADSRPSS
jgi:hypothetical protein